MPRTSKDSGAAPAVQAPKETSTVGRSEKSVNPNVPPESFPPSAPVRHANLAKRIVLTAFLSLGTLAILLLVWALTGYWNASRGLSGGIAAVPSTAVGYPRVATERSGIKFQSPDYLGAGGGTGIDVQNIVPPMPSYPSEENAATPEVPTERKIIKNGNLTLLVSDVTLAADRIQNIVSVFGGFVESKSFNDTQIYPYGYAEKTRVAQNRHGSMTVRVPSDRFEEAFGSIKVIAIRVESESSGGQDVSAQYVDLEARLKNLRATEERYLALIDNAKNVEEVLKVESYLSSTRENIERIQGQLNLLSRQVSMSSITITLVPEPSPSAEGNDWRPLTVAKGALSNLTAGLIEFANDAIAFVIILPLLLIRIALWVIAFLLAWQVGKWLYRRVRGASLPPSGGAVS